MTVDISAWKKSVYMRDIEPDVPSENRAGKGISIVSLRASMPVHQSYSFFESCQSVSGCCSIGLPICLFVSSPLVVYARSFLHMCFLEIQI